jgi:hypothetical protein
MAVIAISSSTTPQTLLPACNRRLATIRNTDANKEPSAALHTVALSTGDYYEVPSRYQGEIRGVWEGDGSGAAMVSESH